MSERDQFTAKDSRFTLTVRELLSDWPKYGNFLDFQREEVWPHNKERFFIEGLLRGYSMPEFPVVTLKDGFAFVDGKQRIVTVRKFVESAFTTFKDKENPPYGSVDPNKFYPQLMPQWQEMIMNSILALHVVGEMEEWMRADYYRWLQYHQSLNLPERVWTYPSETKRQAVKLLEHAFWHDIYQGSQSRMYPFLGCYYVMLLEVTEAGANMDRRRLIEFASGADDNSVSAALIKTIQRRLDRAKHVFDGVVLKSVKEIIPVYQAIGILEKAKFDLETPVARGCLTDWYRNVQENAIISRQKFHVVDNLFKMTHVNYRDLFWDQQEQSILEAVKVYWKGGEKGGSKPNPLQGIDLQAVVNKQRGLCLYCDRAIENVFGGDYLLQYKKDGPLTQENGAVAHKACHQRLLQAHPELELAAVDITDEMRKTA